MSLCLCGSLLKLFHRAGFRVRNLEAVPGLGYAERQQRGRRPKVRVGELLMGVQTPGDAEKFYTAKYRVEDVPADRFATPTTVVPRPLPTRAYTRRPEGIRLPGHLQ